MKKYLLLFTFILPIILLSQDELNNENKLLSDNSQNLQKIIKNNNKFFFNQLFKDKYKNDLDYFNKTKLNSENDLYGYEGRNAYLANIIADDSQTSEDIELAQKAMHFNNAYIEFFNLREENKDFFDSKINENITENYINSLERLDLRDYLGLIDDRDEILNDIERYKNETCQLKNQLEQFFKKDLVYDATLGETIKKMENVVDFPYLKKFIRNLSKAPASFNSNLLVCIEIKEEPKQESPSDENMTKNKVEEISPGSKFDGVNKDLKEKKTNELQDGIDTP